MESIRMHLIIRGFIGDYTIWSMHGRSVRMFHKKTMMM